MNFHTCEYYTQMVKTLDEWTTAYIALGSNLFNKTENLSKAIEYLGNIEGLRVIKCSDFIETKAEGFETEHDFLNAVVEIESKISPEYLLNELLCIEKEMGRVRSENGYSDRPIDLDIIAFGKMIYKSKNLIIPHPEMHCRTFVLIPLSEINKEWKHPVLNKSAIELQMELKNRSV